jgi:hypothetical protein
MDEQRDEVRGKERGDRGGKGIYQIQDEQSADSTCPEQAA